VDVRGVSLGVVLKWDDNAKLKQVVLANSYSGEDSGNFDRYGIHRTLCDALQERYGPPDERNNTASETVVVWRFPETIIKCVHGVRRTDTAWSIKYVHVSYEPPSEANEQGDENL